MKKKVLFCVHDFQHGGISKALQSIIQMIDRERLDISIFCSCQNGAYTDFFRQHHCLTQDWLMWLFCVNFHQVHGLKKIMALVAKTVRKVLLRVGVDLIKLRFTYLARNIERMGYDVIIAYAEGHITHFVAEMNAPCKIAWLHSDYKRFLEYGERPWDGIVEKYQYLISPCEYSADSLRRNLAPYAHKVLNLPNLINENDIRMRSKEAKDLDYRFNTSEVVICSVGRVCVEKRFYKIPAIAKKLLDSGLKFKWYVIGPGSPLEIDIFLKEIEKYNMQERVIWLGRQDNPYPYIAKSDVVVVLSISETFCYVIYEAWVLGIPVISSDFGSANEIMDERYGLVKNIDEIHNGIIQLVKQGNASYYHDKLSNYRYDNQTILNQLYALIES